MLQTDLKHQDGEVEQIKLSAADLCLVGTIGGATVPLLISINGQQLAQGVQLTGNMLLLKTVPNKQPLADIIRELVLMSEEKKIGKGGIESIKGSERLWHY